MVCLSCHFRWSLMGTNYCTITAGEKDYYYGVIMSILSMNGWSRLIKWFEPSKWSIADKVGIKMEDLKGIRKHCTKKFKKEANHTLNSWPFFMVRHCLTNKAIQLGVEILFVDPKGTSQTCFKCGLVDKKSRNGKCFACTACKHVDHADVNAALNIALRPKIDRARKLPRSRGPVKSLGSDGAESAPTSKDLLL